MAKINRQTGQYQGMRIEVRNGNIDKALRQMKKLLIAEGVPQELRDRSFYQKPSTKKQREKARAIKREQKRVAKSVK